MNGDDLERRQFMDFFGALVCKHAPLDADDARVFPVGIQVEAERTVDGFNAVQEAEEGRLLERTYDTLQCASTDLARIGIVDAVEAIKPHLEWYRRALAKGTTRKRRNAPIWRGASNIYNALVIRKVPRPRYWAAGLLYFAGIPGEDLGIYPGDDLVQIYQNQSSYNNSKILKRIEDRLRRNILVHCEEAISLYPERRRRRLMKQYGLPLIKG